MRGETSKLGWEWEEKQVNKDDNEKRNRKNTHSKSKNRKLWYLVFYFSSLGWVSLFAWSFKKKIIFDQTSIFSKNYEYIFVINWNNNQPNIFLECRK